MEDFNNSEPQVINEFQEEEQLSHLDKITGLITEPTKMFEQTAKFPPKFIDWFLPILSVGLMVFVTLFLLNSNPNIQEQFKQKQIEQIESSVEKGRMSEEQAEQAIENIERFSSSIFIVISGISGFIGIFIIFLIIAVIYLLGAKYAAKGTGNYSSALVGSGLPYYIFLISSIVTLIYSLITEKFAQSFSIGELLSYEKTSTIGYWLHKLDPFTIWALILTSIGLAKMFHSNDTKKYYFIVFGLWFGWAVIQFVLSRMFGFMNF